MWLWPLNNWIKTVVFWNALLRPVAQLYGQVRTYWNQCFVTDCSLSHTARYKPFTRSHSVLHTTWLNIHAVRWMRFASLAFLCIYLWRRRPWFAFVVSSAVSELSSDRSIDCFLRYVCCLIVVNDKSQFVLMADRCCRFASVKPEQNSRQ